MSPRSWPRGFGKQDSEGRQMKSTMALIYSFTSSKYANSLVFIFREITVWNGWRIANGIREFRTQRPDLRGVNHWARR